MTSPVMLLCALIFLCVSSPAQIVLDVHTGFGLSHPSHGVLPYTPSYGVWKDGLRLGADVGTELSDRFLIVFSIDYTKRSYAAYTNVSALNGSVTGGDGSIWRYGLGLRARTRPGHRLSMFVQIGAVLTNQTYGRVLYEAGGFFSQPPMTFVHGAPDPSAVFIRPAARVGVEVYLLDEAGISLSGSLLQGQYRDAYAVGAVGVFVRINVQERR